MYSEILKKNVIFIVATFYFLPLKINEAKKTKLIDNPLLGNDATSFLNHGRLHCTKNEVFHLGFFHFLCSVRTKFLI